MCNTARGRRLSENEEMINSILMNTLHRMIFACDFIDGRHYHEAEELAVEDIHLIIIIEISCFFKWFMTREKS